VIEDSSKARENILLSDSLHTEGLDVRNCVRLEKVTLTSTSESEISEQNFPARFDVNQSASNFGNEDDSPESPELSTLNLDDNNGASSHEANSSSDCRPKTNTTSFKQSDDPISWFGVLVPQSLRNVQNSFTSVVETIVPQLVNVMMDMREAELKIYDLRNKVGE
jgi:coiled-coil domain-containing protein 115